MHFLDLASAVEKLRWAEKEWRELDQEVSEAKTAGVEEDEADGSDPELVEARGA